MTMGILPLILAGIADTALIATGKGKERRQIEAEQRKEGIKIAHEQAKSATENGNMPQLVAAANALKQYGVRDAAIGPYFEGIKQPMEFQSKVGSFLNTLQSQGMGRNAQQGGQGMPPVNEAAPTQPQSLPMTPPSNTPSSTSSFNIGNIRKDAKSFQSYASPEEGVSAAADLLKRNYRGMTLAQIGNKWAPPSENDTPTWIKNVSTASGLNPKEVVDVDNPEHLTKLISGIGRAEKSKADLAHFTPDVIDRGVKQAFVQSGPSVNQPVSPGAANVHTTDSALSQVAAVPAFRPELGVEVTLGKNGLPTGMKIDPSKMTLTTQQQMAETLAQNPSLYRAYVNSQIYGNTPYTMQPVHNEITGVDGVRIIRNSDGALLGTTWDSQPTKLNPRQKIDIAAQQAGEETARRTQAGIEALQQPYGMNAQGQPQAFQDVAIQQAAQKTAAETAARTVSTAQAGQQVIPTPQGERTVKQVTEKVPEEIRKASVDARAKVYSFQRFSQDVQDAGTVKGKFDMNNLPVGPFSRFREIPEHYGITQTDYSVNRQLFVDAMTTAIADLYSTGGKQLSDREIENLKANILNPELAPHEWVSRAARWWEKGQDHLRAQIETWKAEGHDVSDLEGVLTQSQALSPWNWLPGNLRPKRVSDAMMNSWLDSARTSNPGVPDEELKAFYEKKHGGKK